MSYHHNIQTHVKALYEYGQIYNSLFHITVNMRNKKESVELFVYPAIGIWRGLSTNKQYPTLVRYGVAQNVLTQHTDTSDECYCLPCTILKSPNFIAKD